jgi:hypothetical protein
MTFKRWLPTFLAFPIGGLLALLVVGSLDDPLSGAVGGLLAGAVIGAGQWLALRSSGIGHRWIPYTGAAMAAGTALGAAFTGAGTELEDLMLTGLVAGAGGRRRTVHAAGARGAALGGLDRGDGGELAAWLAGHLGCRRHQRGPRVLRVRRQRRAARDRPHRTGAATHARRDQ